jgi:copper chaperone CopZ
MITSKAKLGQFYSKMVTKKIYNIKGMDCDSCAKMIELDMEDAGFNASCSFAKELLEVDVTGKDDEKKIKEIISKGGYKLHS